MAISPYDATETPATPPTETPASTDTGGGITDFKSFIATTMFRDMMTQAYTKGSGWTQTLFEYLTGFMGKFYHNIVSIPTLRSSYTIVVKPETLFIDPPSCNIIYPNMVINSSFQRNPKSEPTRILQLTDPVSNLIFPGSKQAGIYSIATIALMDYDGNNEVVKKISNIASGDQLKNPLNIITEFEKDNGVRLRSTKHGEDLYLYMSSKKDGKKTMKLKLEEAANMLFKLAEYNLVRERYRTRPGSVTTYFNPYVVPGFPMVQLTSAHDSGLNVHGYVETVTHNLSDRLWTTSISYNYTHIDSELKPGVFPIIEQEYVSNLAKTYTETLGEEVKPINQTDGLGTCRAVYKASNGTLTESIQKVWRPLPTISEYFSAIGQSYSLKTHPNLPYCYFGEPDTSNATKRELRASDDFFNPKLQGIIKLYTEKILSGKAFSIPDVT